MSFEIKAEGVEVERLRSAIREQIEAKKGDLYSEEELQALAERGLEAVLRAGELRGELLEEFKARDGQWNYSFDPETVYRSSRGVVGQALEAIRRLLRYYVHLLHNLVLELSRLNLELQELRNRNLQLSGRVELLARREKTLEEMVGADRMQSEPEAESDRGRG
jgi:hypothetical protein